MIVKGNTLHVIDLKYGQGVKVYAKENTQGILYALGAYAMTQGIYDIEKVVIVIHQPRLDHVDEWELGVDELMAWGEKLGEAAKATEAKDAPRVPGDKQCSFCKAKATCPALEKHTREILMSDFEKYSSPGLDTLSDEQMSRALANKKLVLSWLDAIEKLAMSRLNDGEAFPGFKLVAGRSSRKWSDELEAAGTLTELLGDEAAFEPAKVLSPAKAEKALGKKRAAEIDGLILKSDGAPTIVPASDPRPSVGGSVDDFDEVD